MARAVTDMVFKIYGTISYNDRSHAPIEVTLSYNNNISNPYTNLVDFATLQRDELDVVAEFLGTLFPGLVVLTPVTTPASKTVTDFVLLMSGIITYDDKSYDQFVVEYRNGVTNFIPASTATDWADMVNFNKPLLVSVFEKLTGVGGVVLAVYLFAECFIGCSGTISSGSPGPVCDWTFDSVFGPGSATITFTPGVMTINTVGLNDHPGATKPLSDPLETVAGVSGRFEFTEYQTAPNGTTTYQLFINNAALTETIVVSLFGDGNAVLQFGPVNAAPTYTASWTPNGGTHRIHFSTGTTPTLFLDDVSLPLSFLGNVATFSTSLPPNIVGIFGGAGVAATASSPVRNIFITSENTGPQAMLGCQ